MMDPWAEGRTALITGATSGFGEAFARRVLAGGGRVIATGRREERLKAFADEVHTDRLLTAALDLRDGAGIKALVAELPPAFSTTPGWPWACTRPRRPISPTGRR
jgi:NADP-dependent 3-hydroxy acid dehydrogenase YdfG